MSWPLLNAVRRYLCAVGVLTSCAFGLILGDGAPRDRSRSKVSLAVRLPATAEPTARVALPEWERSHTLLTPVALDSIPTPTRPDPSASARLLQSYGQLPLSFEVNQGQTDEGVKFLSRGRIYAVSDL